MIQLRQWLMTLGIEFIKGVKRVFEKYGLSMALTMYLSPEPIIRHLLGG